jgi:DNA-binding protein HU-beta
MKTLNAQDLIDQMAEAANISKKAAELALKGFRSAITGALKKGNSVSLIGFGTFEVRQRAARDGRNPQTGKAIKIPASKVPAFKAGKGLKDAVAGRA